MVGRRLGTISAKLKRRAAAVSAACVLAFTMAGNGNAAESTSATGSSPAGMGDGATLSFAIVPQQSATKLAASWGPILRAVGERSGVSLGFATAPNIPTFEKRLADGEYDVAYMNPYHYVVFHQAPGYRAIARERDRRIIGLIVTRADNPITDVAALKGAFLAFPSPGAFAASVLPRAALRNAGIDFTPRYVSSHDSVYLAVANGLFPAGGGIARTFETAPADVRDKLRVLWRTEPHSPHAIAVHPRVSDAVVRRLTDALTGLADDPAGRELLAVIGFSGIEAAADAQWDDIRALGIKPGDAGGL